MALAERLERNERDTGVGGVGELQGIQARERDGVGHTVGFLGDLGDLAQHFIGTRDRRTLRQLHTRDQVQLVLGRNEARRHQLEDEAGTDQQHRVHHEHRATTTEDLRHATLVLFRAGLEEAVERTEHPAEQTVDDAGRGILRRAMRLEQAGRQGRRQGQRVDRRDHRGDGDGDRELLVELTGDARQERHRHEHRTQHQRDGDDRPGHFAHRLMRSGQRGKAFLDVAFNVFHHHDRVIDHDADRQHQAEQAQRVDREAQQVQRAERTDDRHRHRDERDDRGTPGLQEQDHHQHHQRDGFQQGGDHCLDRVAHEDGGVIHRLVLHVGRHGLLHLVHAGHHRIADLQRVGAGGLEDTDTHRVLAVQLRAQGVVAGTQFNPGHVRQPHHFTVYAALEHDVAELLLAAQAALGIDQGQELAVGHRLGAELAGRDLHVLLAHGAHHVAGGQAARGNLVRVQPSAHGVVTTTEDLRVAHALDTCQRVLDVQAGVVAQVQGVVLAVGRGQVHHHQEGGRLLLGGHALPAHVLGQSCLGLGDTVLHLHRRFVRVGARAEGDGHLQHAVRAGHRLEVDHALNAVDGLLQRGGHGFGDHLGVGARIHGTHHDRRRHHFGVLADGQHRDRDQAGGEDHDRQHRREDRPVDEETGKVHGRIPGKGRRRATAALPLTNLVKAVTAAAGTGS
ncbi:hypothetical protein D3C81_588640 [compost metagenome]